MGQYLSTTGSDPATSRLSSFLSADCWALAAKELCLTPRQAEIVYQVLQAKKDKEIAAELGLGVSTVRMHLRHIFNKLNITDRMELAVLVFQHVCRRCDGRVQKNK